MIKAIKGRSGLTHGRGRSESVRLLWVHTLHRPSFCCSVFGITSDAMSHVELGRSGLSSDFTDFNKILAYFAKNLSFNISDSRLRSISSGLVAFHNYC